MKKKSRTEAYIVVEKRLLFHVYSMMKNSRLYREHKPGKPERGKGTASSSVTNHQNHRKIPFDTSLDHPY